MRTSILAMQKQKAEKQPISVLTAYDATSAALVEAAGVAYILVGDSLGMVVQGHSTPIPVTLEQMIYHARMVVNGTEKAMIIGDMPFMSYKISPEQALTNGARFMQESGAGALKLEGGAAIAPTIKRMVEAGIPVMAHIGLTPQSVYQLGGWRVQGRQLEAAQKLVDDALAVEAAGAFAIVLETMPSAVAALVSKRLHIPTIGIGAGAGCDGQVQVYHDLLGLLARTPKHAKRYADLGQTITAAIRAYKSEVEAGLFPTADHNTDLDAETLRALYGEEKAP
jgi:3-methyl-2-oxobutanoate hydroxymethyltransferase